MPLNILHIESNALLWAPAGYVPSVTCRPFSLSHYHNNIMCQHCRLSPLQLHHPFCTIALLASSCYEYACVIT